LGRPRLKIVPGLLLMAAACCFFSACKKQAAAPVHEQARGNSPVDLQFLAACGRGDLAAVRRSLGAGADILARSDYRSGLLAAMDSGSLELVKFLLKKERKLAVLPDAYGVKPLGYLVRGHGTFAAGAEPAQRLALLDLLLAAGADIEETDDYGYGLTPVFFASGRFAPAMVAALLARGAQMNRKSLAAYPDSFCDEDFTLPPGSTPLDKYQALLEVVPADADFDQFRASVLGVIRVLKEHGGRNGAWAARRRQRKVT
jgi:hypothetical protein